MLVNASPITVFAPRRFDIESAQPSVEVLPADVVKRRMMTGSGIAGEIVQATRHETVQFRFRAPLPAQRR